VGTETGISMNGGVRPSVGLMVIIVFCLTVLLGIGGSSAYALWEQGSRTATDQSAESSGFKAP
jgi:hypothetical protein